MSQILLNTCLALGLLSLLASYITSQQKQTYQRRPAPASNQAPYFRPGPRDHDPDQSSWEKILLQQQQKQQQEQQQKQEQEKENNKDPTKEQEQKQEQTIEPSKYKDRQEHITKVGNSNSQNVMTLKIGEDNKIPLMVQKLE